MTTKPSTTHETRELEPCPFHKPEPNLSLAVAEWYSGQRIAFWVVICEACYARGPEEDTREEAIEAWNTRAAPSDTEQVPANPCRCNSIMRST